MRQFGGISIVANQPVEEISLRILVLGIQVVAVIKRGNLLLFKSIVLVLTLFEIY